MGRGRCAGSRREAIGRRPPRPPRVSCPASPLPLGPLEQPGPLGVPGPWGVGSPFPAGPTGGPGGQSRGDGSLLGCTARPRGRSRCLLLAFCVAGRLGLRAPGVRGMPRGPPCPPLEDVEGRLLVVHRGGGVHHVPRQVFQHRPACAVLVCTQGAFRWHCGPSRRGGRHRLSDGALRRWVEGHVCQWNPVWR